MTNSFYSFCPRRGRVSGTLEDRLSSRRLQVMGFRKPLRVKSLRATKDCFLGRSGSSPD